MERFIKKAAIILALVSVTTVVFADRGTGKRSTKARTTLNINPSSASLKASILANIKNGISYKGSFFATRQSTNSPEAFSKTMMTYQKGNTTYIIPYKNRVAQADIKQGYTGVKLVIRPNK